LRPMYRTLHRSVIRTSDSRALLSGAAGDLGHLLHRTNRRTRRRSERFDVPRLEVAGSTVGPLLARSAPAVLKDLRAFLQAVHPGSQTHDSPCLWSASSVSESKSESG